jgi:hypothetical protein
MGLQHPIPGYAKSRSSVATPVILPCRRGQDDRSELNIVAFRVINKDGNDLDIRRAKMLGIGTQSGLGQATNRPFSVEANSRGVPLWQMSHGVVK